MDDLLQIRPSQLLSLSSFQCPLCDNSFCQQANLERHLKRHQDEAAARQATMAGAATRHQESQVAAAAAAAAYLQLVGKNSN